ncbi:cuticle protein 19-like [Topomyia yanbarensis]|uniref:cuticle protein 19-like n=1 Tax=Topomyia yanbarensis TaxID=2498891 RepID=UPI00273B594B|nr:cuticle protein 19-like [Topomyia yanbarensis]
MYKVIAVVACLAAVAVAIPYKPVAEPEHYAEPKDGHAQYKFEYGVKDDHTGDHKVQWEQRDGDVVKGSYSLDEPDGGHRIVEYHSDAHGGIQIQVKKVGGHASAPAAHHEPIPIAPVPIKSIKKHRY